MLFRASDSLRETGQFQSSEVLVEVVQMEVKASFASYCPS